MRRRLSRWGLSRQKFDGIVRMDASHSAKAAAILSGRSPAVTMVSSLVSTASEGLRALSGRAALSGLAAGRDGVWRLLTAEVTAGAAGCGCPTGGRRLRGGLGNDGRQKIRRECRRSKAGHQAGVERL